MTIDTPTLLLVAGLVVAVSGVTFILSTALYRIDRYARIWSIAFIAGMLETISTVVWVLSPGGWWAGSVGNGALVLAIGLMWAGCREFNGRKAFSAIPIVASNVVAVAGLVEGPDGGYWAGAEASFAGVVAFAVLAAVETLRGDLRRTMAARVLTFVFAIVAIYYFARAIIFMVRGQSDAVFTVYFGTATTTFVAIVLVIVAAISMTAIQPAHSSRLRDSPAGAASDGGSSIPGVIGQAQFTELATDWLARAQRDREALVLISLAVDDLEHINSAFGREFGDQAIYVVGRIACESAPSAALVAYTGGGSFTILTSAPPFGSPVSIAERLQTALVETPIDAEKGIRAVAPCGVVTTDSAGYALHSLVTAARTALGSAGASGRPGAIVLA